VSTSSTPDYNWTVLPDRDLRWCISARARLAHDDDKSMAQHAIWRDMAVALLTQKRFAKPCCFGGFVDRPICLAGIIGGVNGVQTQRDRCRLSLR